MNWILVQPQYHALMLILALIVIGYAILINRKLNRLHRVQVALCRLVAGELRKEGKYDVLNWIKNGEEITRNASDSLPVDNQRPLFDS